jgi:ankyrin repeat protein
MAHSGRLLRHDERADEIESLISLGQIGEAKRLIANVGFEVYDGYGRTPLQHATLKGEINLLKWLLDEGAHIDHQDQIGYSALHFAAQERNVETANFLLGMGANPNLQDIHGNSPLWTAIFNAKLPTQEQGVVTALLKYGADPELTNKVGKSPRYIYQMFHNKEI